MLVFNCFLDQINVVRFAAVNKISEEDNNNWDALSALAVRLDCPGRRTMMYRWSYTADMEQNVNYCRTPVSPHSLP